MSEEKISILDPSQTPMKTVLNLSWPAILEQMMFTAVSYVDTAMVGSLGALATAAVGINSSCTWLVGGTLSSIGVGFAVQVAQKAGANDTEGARDVVKQAVFTCFTVGILATILCFILAPNIPVWMGGAPEVIPLARSYLMIFMCGLPFAMLSMVFSPLLRCMGDMRTPMMLNITSNIINIILNFFFIYSTRPVELFGTEFIMPGAGWGVAGAAFGTAVAQTFTGLCMLSAVMIRNNPLKVPFRECTRPKKNILMRMVAIGLPVAFERGIITSGQIVSTRIVSSLGTLPLAAHHLANTAETLSFMPGEGIAYAATTLVGQSIGAKDEKAAHAYGVTAIKLGIIIAISTGLLLFIFPRQLIGLFTTDLEVIAIAATVLAIEAFAQPMLAASTISSGAFRGAGDSKWSFYMSAFCMWGIRVPLSAFLTLGLGWGLTGIWTAMCIDLNVRGIICISRFMRGKWAAKAMAKMEAHEAKFATPTGE